MAYIQLFKARQGVIPDFEVEGGNKAHRVCRRLGEPRDMSLWKFFLVNYRCW